jgi:RNA polymerase sigma-70 factor (ECF subfamily)
MMDEPVSNEQVLLQELRKGNVKAFEQIFHCYWQDLYRIARGKLQSHEESEEVIQAVFSALWEKRRTLIIHNLPHYLRVCVRNGVLNVIRANIMKEKYWAYYRSFLPKETNATAEAVAYDDLDEAIQEAVSSLPEKSRKVFTLSRLEGKTNAEIANILELSEKAIEYHLTKSVRALKVRLKDFIL